jgi:hypothetical protein
MLRVVRRLFCPDITPSTWEGQFVRLEGRSLHITVVIVVVISLSL